MTTEAAIEGDRANRRRRTLVAGPAARARLGLLSPSAATTDSPIPKSALPADEPMPPSAVKPVRKKKIAVSPRKTDPLIAAQLAAQEQWRAAHMAKVRQAEAIASALWPAAFCLPRRPLAIGVHAQMIGDDLSAEDVAALLRWWTSRYDYADAIAHGEGRIDLAGKVVKYPSEKERRHAAYLVYGDRADEVLARIAARRVEAPTALRQEIENAAN